MWLWAQRNSTVWGCMTKMHTEGYSAWLWMQTYMREKREQAWQCDSAVTRLIIQKSLVFLEPWCHRFPLWMLLLPSHTCDVYACLCQTGEAGRKRETTAGSEASLDSQLLMLQEPKKKIKRQNLTLTLHPPVSEVVLSPSSSLSLSKIAGAVRSAMSARQPKFFCFFLCVCIFHSLTHTRA